MDETHSGAPNTVRVLVEDETGRRLGYDIDLTDVIHRLKQDIEETEGISTFRQLLTFETNGLELDDHRTFQSCNITENSILYLSSSDDHIVPVIVVQPQAYLEDKPLQDRFNIITKRLKDLWETIHHTKTGDVSISMVSSTLHHFTVPLGERGFSCVKVEVQFQPLQVPGGRIPVAIVLKCIAAHPRRISSVILSLVFPESDIEDIHPTDELGPETKTLIETMDNREIGLNAGIAFQGISAGGGYRRELGTMKSTARVTRMRIEGRVIDDNTASWSLTEDVGQEGGLPHQVSMRFTLGSELAEVNMFECQCRITSVKNGRLTTKYGYQKYLGRGPASPFVEDGN